MVDSGASLNRVGVAVAHSSATTHAVVDVLENAPRDAVVQALDHLGMSWSVEKRKDEKDESSVWIGDSSSTSTYDIRLWTKGRSRESSNPFADRTVRLILGCDPDLEPSVLQSTIAQVVSRSPIDFSKILGANSSVWKAVVSRSSDKNPMVSKSGDFLRGESISERLIGVIQTTVDEMLTNALYNAPVEQGRRLFAARDRTEVIESPSPVTVQCGIDDENITVMVRDEYGSLTAEEVVDNLFRCYRFDQQQVDDKFGGAGLGFFLLLRNANRFVINIEPGQFTEMIVQRKRNQRFRAFSRSSPSLNLCVASNDNPSGQRRVSRRRPVNWAAECVLPNGEVELVTIRDISEHGAFVALENIPEQLSTEEKITLRFDELPQPLLLAVDGPIEAEVRWTGENRHHRCTGIGLKFVAALDLPEGF